LNARAAGHGAAPPQPTRSPQLTRAAGASRRPLPTLAGGPESSDAKPLACSRRPAARGEAARPHGHARRSRDSTPVGLYRHRRLRRRTGTGLQRGRGYHPAMFRPNHAHCLRGAHVTSALFAVLLVAGCGGGASTGSTHSVPAAGTTRPTATSNTPTAAKATTTGAAANTPSSTGTSASTSQTTPSSAKTTSTGAVTGPSNATGPGLSQIRGALSKQQLAKDCVQLLAERSLPKQERTAAAKLCENIAKR
jgi:hypothetical protein